MGSLKKHHTGLWKCGGIMASHRHRWSPWSLDNLFGRLAGHPSPHDSEIDDQQLQHLMRLMRLMFFGTFMDLTWLSALEVFGMTFRAKVLLSSWQASLDKLQGLRLNPGGCRFGHSSHVLPSILWNLWVSWLQVLLLTCDLQDPSNKNHHGFHTFISVDVCRPIFDPFWCRGWPTISSHLCPGPSPAHEDRRM